MIKPSNQIKKILDKIQKNYPEVSKVQSYENNFMSFESSSQLVSRVQTANQNQSIHPAPSQTRMQSMNAIKRQSISNLVRQGSFNNINKSSNSSPQRKNKGFQGMISNTQINFANNQNQNGATLLSQRKPGLDQNTYIENLEKKLNELNGGKNNEKKSLNTLYKPVDTYKKRNTQKKLKMCRQFVVTGLCRNGQACPLAHNIQELDIQYIPKVWSKHFEQHKKSNQYLSELKYNFTDRENNQENYDDEEDDDDGGENLEQEENNYLNDQSQTKLKEDNQKLIQRQGEKSAREITSSIKKQTDESQIITKSFTNTIDMAQSHKNLKQKQELSFIMRRNNQSSINFHNKPSTASSMMRTQKMNESSNYIVDINRIINQRGRSLLLEAVLLGQKEVVKELLLKGANPCITDWSGNDCIFYSIKKNSSDILRYLLDYSQFDIDLNKQFSTSKTTYLIYASQNGLTNIVIILLAQGADPNISDQFKRTPLTFAVKNNDVDTIQALCENGAQGTIVDDYNKTPVDYAFAKKQLDIVTYLFKKGGVFADQKRNRKVMFFAAENNLIDLIHEMIQRNNPITDKDPHGNNILMLLYKNRHFDSILKIIDDFNLFAQICEKNHDGDCILTLASKESNEILAVKLIQKYSSSININIQDKEGKSCLIHACEHGLDDLVELLLQNGADCNAYDRNWDTPLLLASKNNHLMCVKYILQYAKVIDILWKDQYQNTARNCSKSAAIKNLISAYMIQYDKMSDSLIKELEDEEFNLKQYFDSGNNNTNTLSTKKGSIVDAFSQSKRGFRITKKIGI